MLFFVFVAVGVPLALPFSCSGFGVIVFIRLVVEIVEEGREDGVEMVQEYVHVEAIEINNPLVDVLSVMALAAIFEKKLGGAVHRPQDLCNKCVLDCNFFFVDDAVFSVSILHKIPNLGFKDAVFAEDRIYCDRECFQLVIEEVKVLGDRNCPLS